MDDKNIKTAAKNTSVIWAILAVLLFFLGIFFLTRTLRDLKREGFFGPPIAQDFHRRKIAVADIQDWMTFDFLNKSFGLPSDYLKKGLGINDKKYPNITISRWAKDTQENPSVTLDKIKKMIQDFQNP